MITLLPILGRLGLRGRLVSLLGLASLLGSLGEGGCEGSGEGAVSGHLFLYGCPDQGGMDPSAQLAPPAFDLQPQFFSAEPILPVLPAMDDRGVSRLIIRLQRTPHPPERTDLFELYLVDVDTLLARLGQEQPITPAPLLQPGQPLPQQAPPYAQASIGLHGTCPLARVEPSLSGGVTLQSLGLSLGDELAADFHVTATDARAQRDQTPPQAAGALTGHFRFHIQAGPASSGP